MSAGAPAPPEAVADDNPRWLWDQISTFLVAVIIALGIRACVIEPFRIPSESMLPTLLVGDHLFVNKFVYGIKVPFSDTRLPALRKPERGDVVVFTVAKDGGRTYPADLQPELPREEFVKRIVGLPGDRVEVRGGAVFVNGDPMPERSLPEPFMDGSGHALEVREVRAGERLYRVLDDPRDPYPTANTALTVKPGRYFVLGDNRDHSKDSRIWGTVRETELKGPAFLLYWSWDFNGSWSQLLSPATWWELLTDRTRWDRFGDPVQ